MKKILALVITFLMILATCAIAETEAPVQPQTRTTTITLEGIDEEIVETLYVSESGFSVRYQADLFQLDAPDGQVHLFAISSTPEGEVPGLTTSSSYLLAVPVEIAYEDTDAFLLEATGGFDPSVATIGESTCETLENGIEIKSILVTEESTAYYYYIVTNGEKVLCISAICPLEAMEGWGVRFYNTVKTIEF